MGYHTDFIGEFNLNKELSPKHKAYLEKFAETRRMKRDSGLAEQLIDVARKAVKLPIGVQGAYFVGGVGYCGQNEDISVKDHNSPPTGQPSLWCQWVPRDDGKAIVWDGGEKFYEYVDWIEYLIDNFLAKWGYKLNGEVEWCGEDANDRGKIVVKDNKVTTLVGRIVYEEETSLLRI
jgi:hypothetical protein